MSNADRMNDKKNETNMEHTLKSTTYMDVRW